MRGFSEVSEYVQDDLETPVKRTICHRNLSQLLFALTTSTIDLGLADASGLVRSEMELQQQDRALSTAFMILMKELEAGRCSTD